jgi:hypothetical protein
MYYEFAIILNQRRQGQPIRDVGGPEQYIYTG